MLESFEIVGLFREEQSSRCNDMNIWAGTDRFNINANHAEEALILISDQFKMDFHIFVLFVLSC